jgi:hypothetical protein
MRRLAVALVLVSSACASRSTLHAERADAVDAAEPVDVAPDTWAREVSGATCSERPAMCPVDDWGPARAVQELFAECTAATGVACGDLRLVFDGEGCLAAIDEIATYSPAFVDCVARAASATRWKCASGGAAYHMFQSCDL